MNTPDPIHPGEHLAEFLEELGISQYRLAKTIGVPPIRINAIIKQPTSNLRRHRAAHRPRSRNYPRLLAKPTANVRHRHCSLHNRHQQYRTTGGNTRGNLTEFFDVQKKSTVSV